MRKSEIKLAPTGEVEYRQCQSGPFKTGETVLWIEIVQSEDSALDGMRLALLRRQIETFLSTLGEDPRLTAEMATERLRHEVKPETWKTLLSVGTDRTCWLIQAWTAEVRFVIDCREPGPGRMSDADGMLALLSRGVSALQFPGLIGFKKQ